MEVEEDLIKVQQLINQGEYQQALDEVKRLEKIIEYPDDQLSLYLSKVRFFIEWGT